MDSPRVRIGWLRMLLRVFRGTGGGALYGDLIAITERLIADAEAELTTSGERGGKEGSDVRQRP
jgi:hypothetical protein